MRRPINERVLLCLFLKLLGMHCKPLVDVTGLEAVFANTNCTVWGFVQHVHSRSLPAANSARPAIMQPNARHCQDALEVGAAGRAVFRSATRSRSFGPATSTRAVKSSADDRSWPLASFRTHALNDRSWSNNGHRVAQTRNPSVAFDPKWACAIEISRVATRLCTPFP